MDQATLEKWEKEYEEAQQTEIPEMYEYNINRIHKEYAGFDPEVGLPSTSITLGEDCTLSIRAFMSWRALVCEYYCAVILSDPISFSYTINYYDKYEIPTCYRTIKIGFNELPSSPIKEGDTNPFEGAEKYFKRVLERYLISVGFIRIKEKSYWQKFRDKVINIYNSTILKMPF